MATKSEAERCLVTKVTQQGRIFECVRPKGHHLQVVKIVDGRPTYAKEFIGHGFVRKLEELNEQAE